MFWNNHCFFQYINVSTLVDQNIKLIHINSSDHLHVDKMTFNKIANPESI